LTATTKEMQTKIDYLIKKCNKQVDYIHEQKMQLDEKNKTIEFLENIIKKQEILDSAGIDYFISILRIFYEVLILCVKNNSFFEHKRNTEKSRRYLAIGYSAISGYIESLSAGYTVKKIMKIWAEFGLIYKDDDDNFIVNFTYEKRSIRSVRVNKAAIEMVKESIIYD